MGCDRVMFMGFLPLFAKWWYTQCAVDQSTINSCIASWLFLHGDLSPHARRVLGIFPLF